MKKGFTIIELLLAMALLFALLAGSGLVFSEAIKAHRAAKATSEVSAKLRVITQQLEADFQGLRQDGEIAIAWQVDPSLSVDRDGDGLIADDEYVHFDRLMFFTDGDFSTYNQWPVDDVGTQEVLNGNLARVCYMLAGDGQGDLANGFADARRVLARSQHLYIAAPVYDGVDVINFPDLAALGDFTAELNNGYEFDTITMSEWGNIAFDPLGASDKSNMLAEVFALDLMATGNAGVGSVIQTDPYDGAGNPVPPTGLHMLLSERISEFRIQAWNETAQDWYPQIENGQWLFSPPGEDFSGSFASTNHIDNTMDNQSPVVLYQPGGTYFTVSGETTADESNGPLPLVDAPGFGKALKFTFTIHDENGFFENGKTFTYIVKLN